MHRTSTAILAVAAFAAALFAAQPASAYTAKHPQSYYLCHLDLYEDVDPNDTYNVVVDACTEVIQADDSERFEAVLTRAEAYCKLGQYALAVRDYQSLASPDGDDLISRHELLDAKDALAGKPNLECEREEPRTTNPNYYLPQGTPTFSRKKKHK